EKWLVGGRAWQSRVAVQSKIRWSPWAQPVSFRRAAAQALKVAAEPAIVVTGHLSLVNEPKRDGTINAGARANHAGFWRQMMELTKGEERPIFRRQGPHLSYDQAVGKECDLVDWIGNRWGDFFAGLGRDDVFLPESFVRDCKMKSGNSVDAITILGKLAQRRAEWAQKLERNGSTKAGPAKIPAANIEYHELWHNPDP
ncbi:unnamed protein product, partial [Prorocentrum cordatum]